MKSRPRFEVVSPCPIPLTITITLRTPSELMNARFCWLDHIGVYMCRNPWENVAYCCIELSVEDFWGGMFCLCDQSYYRETAMRGCKQFTWVDNRNMWLLGNYIYKGTYVRQSVTVIHRDTESCESQPASAQRGVGQWPTTDPDWELLVEEAGRVLSGALIMAQCEEDMVNVVVFCLFSFVCLCLSLTPTVVSALSRIKRYIFIKKSVMVLRAKQHYEFIFISFAIPSMSCLSYLDGLWDGR